MKCVKLNGITWDIDGKDFDGKRYHTAAEMGLPENTEVVIEVDDDDEATMEMAIDRLTDKAGFCIKEVESSLIVEGEECDECEEFIPDVPGGGLANRHHHVSCSLHEPDHE